MADHPDRAEARHVLRPGVVVVPRPPGRLVVGHDRAAAALADDDAARRLLASLGGGGRRRPDRSDAPGVWQGWRRLEDAGLLVPAAVLARSREVAGTALGVPAADAAVLIHGEDAPAVLRARLSAAVAVHGPEQVRAPATEALRAAGVPLAAVPGRAVVHLLGGDVAPAPSLVADVVRRGLPHLVVVRDVAAVTVGPFVVPGDTACTGCLEAAGADRDPEHGLLRLLRARELRERTVPAEPAVLALALAVAARDLAVWAAGDAPSTWSATRTFPLTGGEERAELRRHPRCGCAWDALTG